MILVDGEAQGKLTNQFQLKWGSKDPIGQLNKYHPSLIIFYSLTTYYLKNCRRVTSQDKNIKIEIFFLGYADEKKHVNPIWKMLILLFGVVSCVALIMSIYMVHSALGEYFQGKSEF